MSVTTIDTTLQLGDPVEHRGIVIAPLFPRRQPVARYLTLAEAIALGFRVTEVDASGSVPELLVHNPLEENVLLYDGEELVGAKQNRILNVTVLVAGGGKTRIPVSCVEQGRWSARSAAFSDASHTAYPELRRRKAERLAAAPMALGVAQSEVWESVAAKADRLDADAPTGAQADIFRAREGALAGLREAFPFLPGQAGALFALGPRQLCLDFVSRPDAFAQLYGKLLDGYLLDAVEALDGKPAGADELEGFLTRVAAAPRSRHPSVGLGDDLRLRTEDVVGSGLELEGELVQLSAFSSENDGPSRSRIARPSRRH